MQRHSLKPSRRCRYRCRLRPRVQLNLQSEVKTHRRLSHVLGIESVSLLEVLHAQALTFWSDSSRAERPRCGGRLHGFDTTGPVMSNSFYSADMANYRKILFSALLGCVIVVAIPFRVKSLPESHFEVLNAAKFARTA